MEYYLRQFIRSAIDRETRAKLDREEERLKQERRKDGKNRWQRERYAERKLAKAA